jgi:dihydrodipicolinate synthase/N-acetylneuraminate lyase
MKKMAKYCGAVVPLVTPFTPSGGLDEASLDRLVDAQIAGGVAGIFVLGTTGEGAHVPHQFRLGLVEQVVRRVNGRALVYAGIGDTHPEGVISGNEFLRAGADVIVSRPPAGMPVTKLESWYRSLLDGLEGRLFIYNMPLTTKVSIPLDVIGNLLGHPRLAGIKDSENDPQRLEQLLQRFGGKRDFSVFVGVGALMEKGLKLGADGIVPSVGNLIPDVCQQLCVAAQKADWPKAERLAARMNVVASLYQKGRNLNESLAALKAAMHCHELCGTDVLPPLRKVSAVELEKIRSQMRELHLLNGT